MSESGNYQRFREMIDSLPESERDNFTSRILAHFESKYPLQYREVMTTAYIEVRGKKK